MYKQGTAGRTKAVWQGMGG